MTDQQRSRAAPAALVVLLALWTIVPLVALTVHVHGRSRWFPWVLESPYDQLQYFAWIRDMSEHVLGSNLFRIGDSGHVFTDPFFAPAALLARLGLSPELAFWALAPVTIALLALGPYAWAVERLGPGPLAGWAVVLAVFYFAPVYVLLDWAGEGTGRVGAAAGALFVAPLAWGGLPAATAIGLVPVVLLLVERERLHLGAVLAFTAAWVHPWQGEQIAITCAAAFVLDPRPRRARLPLAAAALAVVPAVAYFALLGRLDHDWEVARLQAHSGDVRVWALAVVLAPLALPALLGARWSRDDVGDRLLVLLPLACLAAFAITPSVRAHALGGMTIPLAILAARGWTRLRWPGTLGAGAVGAVAALSIIQTGRLLGQVTDSPVYPYSIDKNERAALAFLDRAPRDGGVLARMPVSSLVPAYSGRQTWVGHQSWTPDANVRAALADRLMRGGGDPPRARAFVAATGARFVLADCRANHRSLARALAPITAARRRFGCAAVYRLRG